MQIGALGDVHGEFDTVQSIMQRHAEVPLWVCVGDVASNDGEYFVPGKPLYFIKGNNEDFDVIATAAKGESPAPTLHYLPNGGPHRVGPWRVGGARAGRRAAPRGDPAAPPAATRPAPPPPAPHRQGGRPPPPQTSLKLGKS